MSGSALRVGRYTLRRKLGTGGMAEVWLADLTAAAGFKKQVVVKAILPHLASDPEFVRLFQQEARLAARLNHPNVVQVFELHEEAGQYYSIMEWVDGASLRVLDREAKRRGERLPVGVVVRMLHDACLGLDHVHGLRDEAGQPLNVVHRDISPDNILITRSGTAKVADFGIARASDTTSHTRPGQVKGKLAYVAPETYLGSAPDGRVDLYAVGLVAYELLSGVQPFRADSEAETMHRVLHAEVPPLRSAWPEAPEALERAVMRALARDRDARFSSAAELARALEPFAAPLEAVMERVVALAPEAPQPGGEPTDPTGSASSGQRSRGVSRAVVVFVLVAAAVCSGAVVAWRQFARGEPKPAPVVVAEPVVPVAEPEPEPEPEPAPPHEPAAEDPKRARPAPPRKKPATGKTGKLIVRAYPWADVLVDEEPAGMTPLAPMSLETGTHRVTLVNGSLGVRRSVSVVVKAGKTATVEVDLSRAP